MSDHVANLMTQESGYFILVLRQRDDAAGEIDIATCSPEGVIAGQINDGKTVMGFCGRKLGE